MQDPALEAAGEHAREVVEPLGIDPVFAERLVLSANLLALLLVGREPKAPGPPQRVARKLLDPVERALGPVPEPPRALRSVRFTGDVVPRGAAAQREAAVAPARAFRHATRVVHAHAQTAFGKAQRCCAAGDTRADDRYINGAFVSRRRARDRRIFEPVRIHAPIFSRKLGVTTCRSPLSDRLGLAPILASSYRDST